MKKKLKPIRRKGAFFFCRRRTNTKKRFSDLLKSLVTTYNDHYYVVTEDSSFSATGDMHFRLHERPSKKHSVRAIDIFYRASASEVQLNFIQEVLPKSLSSKRKVKVLKASELTARTVRSTITGWFKKQRMQGYKFHVTFKTEFPLFDYDKTLYIEVTGSTLAKDVVDEIFEKETNPTELERFRQAFRSARHMCDCTLHCSVVSLATDKEEVYEGVLASDMMAAEISNQIYRRLTPPVQPDSIANRRQYYWNTILNFFSNLFSGGRKVPSY